MPEDLTVLILARTNPCISKKYVETVCTAGITPRGEWIRLYPLPARLLKKNPGKKYEWITCSVRHNETREDMRPESRKVDEASISVKCKVGTGSRRDWRERRELLLNGLLPIHSNRETIIRGAMDNEFSLCLFRPTKVIGFTKKDVGSEYSANELALIRQHQAQGELFDFEDHIRASELQFRKVPYTFHCKFEDDTGQMMNLEVLDWEMSSRFRKGLANHRSEKSVELTLEHYNGYRDKCDLYFVLGTRNYEHKLLVNSKSTKINPWSIISVIPFPKSTAQPPMPGQLELEL